MSDQFISIPVYVEDSGETIILKLLPQNTAKTTKDINYMTSLITNVYKKRNKNLINQESVQISIDKSNEVDSLLMSSSNLSCTTSLEEQEFDDDPKEQEFDDDPEDENGWANLKDIATEAGPSNEQNILSESYSKNNKDDERKTNKRKIEAVIDNFISDMKEERVEREKRREAKETLFQELKDQRERQHKEKMEIMEKWLDVIAKK
ncbi:hypothetical protein ALC62_05868 [Cyphomyrmex costatus]|uniref:Uncharacterized protein n=1 Tax=Cyphomyrmex costatus TaxID=456900 RepID=A0A151K2K2_9HYME|nr:hypothetical protein ALC62_05868 [Cyphomyrmex costatus]